MAQGRRLLGVTVPAAHHADRDLLETEAARDGLYQAACAATPGAPAARASLIGCAF